jgi:hypothetical protein
MKFVTLIVGVLIFHPFGDEALITTAQYGSHYNLMPG